MIIKQILDEISSEPSTNKKIEILSKYKDNELLKRVLYLANSKRVKFYIKQIPPYTYNPNQDIPPLTFQLICLDKLSKREVTGGDASNLLSSILSSSIPEDAYVIERIIEKDLKIGMGSTNINKVMDGMIEEVGYMGCKSYSKKLVDKILLNGYAFSQKKMDGRYVNIIIRNSEVEMESRQGEPTMLDNPKFLTELISIKDCVLNAELTMLNTSRYESNGIISSLISIQNKKLKGANVDKEILKFEEQHMEYRKALDSIIVTVWDILSIDEYYDRASNTPYYLRLKEVEEVLCGFKLVSCIEYKKVNSTSEIISHFDEVIQSNDEGTVLKSYDGKWKDGKPTWQVKLKKEITLDLKIVGFNYGSGKNLNLISSVNVESEDGLLKTSPTGINEEKMLEITNNKEALMGSILEIKCSGVSKDKSGNYSVLHPVFKIERTDKSIANTLRECIEIDKAYKLLS